MNAAHLAIWCISLLSIAGILIRPFRLPEYVWAVSGALLLLVTGLIRPSEGINGVLKGTDVYFFLIGMMLLSETAREVGVFDWLAVHATRWAKGSPGRLFFLVYGVGMLVTIFLSNDATAVVLTPAVAAAVRAAKVEKPLPYLLICAFIANAASFVLPISNPANLVVYGAQLPALLSWIPQYILPSAVSIGITFWMLRYTQRQALKEPVHTDIPLLPLSAGGKMALAGIGCTAVVLLIVSALHIPLGLPTTITGVLTSAAVLARERVGPRQVIRGISWSVLPLVAGLFVLVEALDKTGVLQDAAGILHRYMAHSEKVAVWGSGVSVALLSNVLNNLPVGLMAGTVVQMGNVPAVIQRALLIGVDIGPNLSVTGSLATILWLLALRREGITISGWTFLKIGALVMTAALAGTLAVLCWG